MQHYRDNKKITTRKNKKMKKTYFEERTKTYFNIMNNNYIFFFAFSFMKINNLPGFGLYNVTHSLTL